MTTRRIAQPWLLVIGLLALSSSAEADVGPSPDSGGAGAFPNGAKIGGVDTATGTVTAGYPFETPVARGGVGLSLGLTYAHTGGAGDAGMGWTLGIPAITRYRGLARTGAGVPVYNEYPFPRLSSDEDNFAFNGARLVEICTLHGEGGCPEAPGETFPAGLGPARYYRLQAEGEFIRFFRLASDTQWLVQRKDGITEEYGYAQGLPDAGGDPVLYDHESAPWTAVRWELSRRYDNHLAANGMRINAALYHWQHLGARGQAYLTDIFDTSDPAAPADVTRFAHHTRLYYQAPDYFTWNAVVERLASKEMRLSHVDVSSLTMAGTGTREQVRRYWLTYYVQPQNGEFIEGTHAPVRGQSFLKSIQLEGRCQTPPRETQGPNDPAPGLPESSSCGRMPATSYQYAGRGTPARGTARQRTPGPVTQTDPYFANPGPGGPLLTTLVGDPTRAQFMDFNRDGLPDLVAGNTFDGQAEVRAFVNSGGSTLSFDMVCVEANPSAGGNGITSLATKKFFGAAANVFGFWGTDTQTGDLWNPSGTTWEWTKLLTKPTVACPAGWGDAISRPKLGFQTVRTAAVPGMPPIEFVNTFADFDADGLTDVLYYDGAAQDHFIRFTRHSLDAGGAPPRVAPFAEKVPVRLRYRPGRDVRYDFLQFADINGDGIPDAIDFSDGSDVFDSSASLTKVVVAEGRGTGAFQCNSAYGSCATPARHLLNADGTHVLARPLNFVGIPMQPYAFYTDGDFEKLTPYFHDLNGDGLADIVQLWFDGTDFPPYKTNVHVSIWLNEDGQTFRRFCTDDPSGQTCTRAQDQVFRDGDALGFGPHAVRFADLDANGIDEVLIVSRDSVYRFDLYGGPAPDREGQLYTHGSVPPGKLVRVENGYGARTDFAYASVQELQATWTTKSPQPAWVVRKVYTRTNVPSPYNHFNETSYEYEDAAYDPWRRKLVGFLKTRVLAPGAGTVETTYAFGSCETPDGCLLSSEDDDLLARRGRPLRVDQRMGAIPVSTTTYVYDHRRLFWGSRYPAPPVYFDPLVLQTTFLFDPDAPDTVETVVVKGRSANNEPIFVPVVLPRSTGERVQQSWTIDNFGNSLEALDWGQVDFTTAAPIDNVHRTTTSFVALSNGWTWRSQQSELGEKNVWGTADPDPVLRRSRTTYDPAGDPLLVEADLWGTTGVSRFHAASAPVAPYPTGESLSGWLVRASYVRSVTGAVTQSHGAEATSFDGPASACASVDYDAWFEFAVHSRRYSGLCGSSTYVDSFAAFDRGFGDGTTQTDPSGRTSVVAYDEFGRVERTYNGDRAGAGGVDSTAATRTTYLPGVNGPFQIVRTETRTGPSSYHDSYVYVDGMGQVLLTVSQADTAAGDGGAWVVAGLSDLNQDGSTARAYQPWFYTGSPVAVPIVRPAGTPAAEYTYDGVGRVTDAKDRGALVQHVKYSGLTTYYSDAEDLGAGPAANTPSYVISNGHGKPKYATRQLVTSAGVDFIHTVRHFDAAGELVYQARVHTEPSGPTSDGRYFQYDSLGRLQWTNEANAAPGSYPFAYSYNDLDQLIGTSDPRGCGVNYFYDGYGRSKAKDLSPCQAYHAPYSTPDLATGDGTESYSEYDVPAIGQPSQEYDSEWHNLIGQLVSVRDRGAYTRFGYDSRGRRRSVSRSIAVPGNPADALGDRYTPHFFNTTSAFDVAGRVISATTGADVPQLTFGGSTVSYQYSARGVVRSIDSSYGPLITASTLDADGAPLTKTYGDVASTKATITYDARRRTAAFDLSRAAPAFWSGTPVAPYTKPPATTTQQTVLAKYVLGYDELSRPSSVEDQAVATQWPAGAKPTRKTYTHDSLGRVLAASAAYRVGSAWTDDSQVSPFSYENAIGDTRPVPARTTGSRTRGQAIAYDWQGNTTSITDATNGIFDRSLGDIVNGDGLGGHPNQITSAGAGAIAAHYDEAGNLEDLTVNRTGNCTAGKCIQRFAYEWDEEGLLVRARRWDYTTLPGAEPVYPALPTRIADWDDSYAYSGMDRVRKTDRNSAGVERHTLEVFGSLRVNRAVFDSGALDYVRTDANETAYLAGIARAQYIASGVPIRSAGDTVHVFFSAGDHLGSTNVVFDSKTSELVEKVSQDAFGRTEADYRPARWAGYREDYRFTGKEEDIEVGATYFGARYYSPYLGRFLSPDPLWIHAGGGDPNPYAYVGGRLADATDPTGLECVVVGTSTSGGTSTVVSDCNDLSKPKTKKEDPNTPIIPELSRARQPSGELQLVGDRVSTSPMQTFDPVQILPSRRAIIQSRQAARTRAANVGLANGALELVNGAVNQLFFGLTHFEPFQPLSYPHSPGLQGAIESDYHSAASKVAPVAAAAAPFVLPSILGTIGEVAPGFGGRASLGPSPSLPTFLNRGEPAGGTLLGVAESGSGGYTIGGVPIRGGSYDFVVQGGQLRIGNGHYFLSGGGAPVEYAGGITFGDGGALLEWTNASGHFRPGATFARNAGLPMGPFRPVNFPSFVGMPELPVFRNP